MGGVAGSGQAERGVAGSGQAERGVAGSGQAEGEADFGRAAAYNYHHFDDYVAGGTDVADEAAFREAPRAGERAPDFTLPRLGDGAPIRLSELWRAKPLVMEFGSFT